MNFVNVLTYSDFQKFYSFGSMLYKDNPHYRDTEHDVLKMLVERKSVFFRHARIQAMLVTDDAGGILGRFCMVVDEHCPDVVQVAFFEALPGISNLAEGIAAQCKKSFPQCSKLIVGLNAHLNYGAGFLCSRFDEAPVFGLPYSMDYYPEYFKAFELKKMFSFRYPAEPFFEYYNSRKRHKDSDKVKVRTMRKKRLKEDIAIYTYLNNASFQKHIYWSDRTEEEDYEIFKPFKPMLDEENLLIAEVDGKPAGFLLWYPDFNQLVKGSGHIGIFEWLRFRVRNHIDTFRFTEFGVHAEYRNSMIVDEMIRKLSEIIEKTPYRTLEGGFIFEENKASIAVSLRYALRTIGKVLEP
jgi:ribosomal protein S18 acetylase RimI-like enzyme